LHIKMNKLLLTAKEVSEMLGIGKSTVYAYAECDILKPIYLPSVKPSKAKLRNRKAIRFPVDVVDEFIHNLPGWSPKREDRDVH